MLFLIVVIAILIPIGILIAILRVIGIAMLPVEDHFHAIFVPVLIHAVAIDAAHILHGNDSALPPGFFLPSTGSIIRQIPTDSF